jgi:hypothetical protein
MTFIFASFYFFYLIISVAKTFTCLYFSSSYYKERLTWEKELKLQLSIVAKRKCVNPTIILSVSCGK